MDIYPVTQGHTGHGTSLLALQNKSAFFSRRSITQGLSSYNSTPSSKMVLCTVTPGPSQTRNAVSALPTGWCLALCAAT